TSGATFTVDNTAPTAAITYSPSGPVKLGTTLTLTATFNEAMADTPAPQFSVSGGNTAPATAMTKVDATPYPGSVVVRAGHDTDRDALDHHRQRLAGDFPRGRDRDGHGGQYGAGRWSQRHGHGGQCRAHYQQRDPAGGRQLQGGAVPGLHRHVQRERHGRHHERHADNRSDDRLDRAQCELRVRLR